MNSVINNITRRSGMFLMKYNKYANKIVLPAYSRALWHMSPRSMPNTKCSPLSILCSCGCRNLIHTNGEKELVNFLKEEIAAENKAMKMKSFPKQLEGFNISTDGAEVTLKKECDNETLSISFNVNHSVDADIDPEVDPKADNPDIGDLKSKPNFEIDIVRGGKTLSFQCSFTGAAAAPETEDGYNDAFTIDEVTYFEGEWNDNTYSVSGDVLDGNLYDLFMTILEEKGISSDFVDKISDVATSHEHRSYIGLLEKLSQFASK